MFAIEFETQIKNGVVHIPQQFERLYQHPKAKIIIMIDEIPMTDFLSKEKAAHQLAELGGTETRLDFIVRRREF
jgi:hypothetical protein